MANYDLKKFKSWIEKTIANIDGAVKETDEMQTAFNSEYVNKFKLDYDSLLSRISDETVKMYFSKTLDISSVFGKSLSDKIKVKTVELNKRKTELEKQLGEIEKRLKSIKESNTKLIGELKKVNPELNEEEESLKTIVSRHEGSAMTLKKNIETMRKGLGFFYNYFTISKLKKNLLKEIEKIKSEKDKLFKVRKKYFEIKSVADSEITDLEKNYGHNLSTAAAIRQELSALQSGFETACVLESAVALLEDSTQETVMELSAKIAGIPDLLKMRTVKKDYEKSLKMVAEEIGFLNGIKSGFTNLAKTADSLLTQYNQYSSYLKAINLNISEKCEAFSNNFKNFSNKIVDDAKLSKTPADFLSLAAPFHKDLLNETVVKSVFEEIAGSIKSATTAWK